jgi:hypothetical protein
MDTNEAIALEERRLQELSLTPKAKMSDEERREYNKLHNRKSRRKTNTTEGMKKLLERAERAETQEQFWQPNRSEQTQAQLDIWLAQESVVLDMLSWMKDGLKLPPNDDCFVSLADGLDLLNDSIQQHGFIKDAFTYTSRVLNEFEPMWGIWADRTFSDSYTKKYWGTVKPYWKDLDRLSALIEENEATKVWALYGIRTALPEFHYYKWMQNLKGQGLVKAS